MNIVHLFSAILLASYFVPVSTCPVSIEPRDILTKVRDSHHRITPDLSEKLKNDSNSGISSILSLNTHTNSLVFPLIIIVLAVLFCLALCFGRHSYVIHSFVSRAIRRICAS